MVEKRADTGFTVAEVIVTLLVMGVFLMLFFQLFFTSQSQQLAVLRRSTANDIAQSNLRKVSSRALIPVTTTACQTGTSSENNPIDNSAATGSVIASSDTTSTDPKWNGDGSPSSGIAKESVTGTALASTTTTQKLVVLYPRGCEPNMPAKIVSTVTYGTETVVHATYVK